MFQSTEEITRSSSSRVKQEILIKPLLVTRQHSYYPRSKSGRGIARSDCCSVLEGKHMAEILEAPRKPSNYSSSHIICCLWATKHRYQKQDSLTQRHDSYERKEKRWKNQTNKKSTTNCGEMEEKPCSSCCFVSALRHYDHAKLDSLIITAVYQSIDEPLFNPFNTRASAPVLTFFSPQLLFSRLPNKHVSSGSRSGEKQHWAELQPWHTYNQHKSPILSQRKVTLDISFSKVLLTGMHQFQV